MTTNTDFSFNIIMGENSIIIPQKNNDIAQHFQELKDGYSNIIKFDKNGLHDLYYIKILDNSHPSLTYDEIIAALIAGNQYFGKLDITINIKNRIVHWVKSLGKHSYTWTELLDKPNYGLEIFKSRYWPYFNVESKDWNDIGAASRSNEYPAQTDPAEVTEAQDRTTVAKDYKIEYGISQKYNNYLGYSVLDPVEYPNMKTIMDRLMALSVLNMPLLMFEAVLRFMITPATCHIIKDHQLYKLIDPLFESNRHYAEIFNHFMYYAMYIMNHEDTVMFSQIRRNYRIIFTHPEALCMPLTYKYHMEIDPYIQQLTGDISLIQTIPYYLRCKRYIQPINVFERRFYLATGGALANIHLSKYNAAVSGSILIPCLTYSELEDDFKDIRFNTIRNIKSKYKYNDDLYNFNGFKLSEDDKDFISYMEYYYPSYHSLVDSDYIKKVLTQVASNNKPINLDCESKAEPESKKKHNLLSDIDISISVDNYETFEEIAHILANQIKLNCAHIGEVWIQKVYTAASSKYKIYGPGLTRPIDLFRVSYDPVKMVKKFHCPIVRSWYDGANAITEDVYNHSIVIDKYRNAKTGIVSNADMSNNQYYTGANMIISSLSTALSGINNTYKWFFSSTPCVEVILKYAQRGYTTIINKKELIAITEYMKRCPQWQPFLKDADMCGSVGKDHVFFNPCSVDAGIRFNLRKFKKQSVSIYSKRIYVGMFNGMTDYGVDLSVKGSTKVNMPDLANINPFIEFIEFAAESGWSGEFSDTDDL